MCRSRPWWPTIPEPIRRRAALAGAIAAALAAHGGGARAAVEEALFADGAAILVAGPRGGRLDRWSDAVAPSLARMLPAGTVLRREVAGGEDGVTGCNQFETRVAPDGATVLLLPGQALLAWLVGDPRARFDVGRFIPLLAGSSPGIMVSRRPLDGVTGADPLRLSAARPDSADLAGMLALEVLGVPWRPVFTLTQDSAPDSADAALLLGPDAPGRLAGLRAAGLRPVLALGAPDNEGAVARDPALPDLPTVPELYRAGAGRTPEGPGFAAWRAVAAAAQLDFLLALMTPTPPAMVALWRQAANALAQTATGESRLAPCPAASRITMPLRVDAPTLLHLRGWLAERLRWQPA